LAVGSAPSKDARIPGLDYYGDFDENWAIDFANSDGLNTPLRNRMFTIVLRSI